MQVGNKTSRAGGAPTVGVKQLILIIIDVYRYCLLIYKLYYIIYFSKLVIVVKILIRIFICLISTRPWPVHSVQSHRREV
jgi:hypothetical protein